MGGECGEGLWGWRVDVCTMRIGCKYVGLLCLYEHRRMGEDIEAGLERREMMMIII